MRTLCHSAASAPRTYVRLTGRPCGCPPESSSTAEPADGGEGNSCRHDDTQQHDAYGSAPASGVNRSARLVWCGHAGSRLRLDFGVRGDRARYRRRTAEQATGRGGAGPSEAGGDQGGEEQEHQVVGEPVADGAPQGKATVLVGRSAATDDGDRDGRVDVEADAGADRGDPGDTSPHDRVAAPQGGGGANNERHDDHLYRRMPGHDVGQYLVEEAESGQGQPDKGDDQAAEQAGNRDTRPAYQCACAEDGADQEEDQKPGLDPVATAEAVMDRHSAVQTDGTGRERDHRPCSGGGPSPGR